jgi:hypothetical protein
MPGMRAAGKRMGHVGQQALIFYFKDIAERADEMGLDDLDALVALQEQLAQVIEPRGIGEVDGNEIAVDGSEGSLYAYGPDARAILQAALPVVCRSPLAAGGHVYLRYGELDDADAAEETFLLSDLCASRNA